MKARKFLRLPFVFDVVRLGADLMKIGEEEWIDHFNSEAYERAWRCVPLHSFEGRRNHILSLSNVDYRDTEILHRCPYFREVIDVFRCRKTSVRLMSLGPGGLIRPHRDRGTSLESGLARLHVPVLTSPEAVFTLDGEDVHFSAGNTWYLNADCLHGAKNESSRPRIHLMLDCIVNPWLEKIFRDAGFEPGAGTKYGDPAIDDANVQEVASRLREMNSVTATQIATRLIAISES